MNQFKVSNKRLVIESEKAIAALDKQILSDKSEGDMTKVIFHESYKRTIFKTLQIAKMQMIESAYLTEEFLTTLNYCLTLK